MSKSKDFKTSKQCSPSQLIGPEIFANLHFQNRRISLLLIQKVNSVIFITHLLLKYFQEKTLFWRTATIKVFKNIISLQLDSLTVLTGMYPNPLTK